MAKLTAIADYTATNAAQDLGYLRICPACQTQYYDKGVWPAVCPVETCGKQYEVHAVLSSGGRTTNREEPTPSADAGESDLLDDDADSVADDDIADADFDEPDTFSEES